MAFACDSWIANGVGWEKGQLGSSLEITRIDACTCGAGTGVIRSPPLLPVDPKMDLRGSGRGKEVVPGKPVLCVGMSFIKWMATIYILLKGGSNV